MRLLFFQIIYLLPLLCISQNIEDPEVLDSLLNSDSKSTFVKHVKLINSDYIKYNIASFNSIDHSISDVKKMMIDFENYSNIFKYIYDFHCIDSTQQVGSIGTFYFEVRLYPFKMWCLFDIYFVEYRETNTMCLKAIQNENLELKNQFKPEKDKYSVIETKNFEFSLLAKKDLPNSSRLSFTGSTIPLKNIPRFLFKIGLRIVFPRFTKDIEKYLAKI